MSLLHWNIQPLLTPHIKGSKGKQCEKPEEIEPYNPQVEIKIHQHWFRSQTLGGRASRRVEHQGGSGRAGAGESSGGWFDRKRVGRWAKSKLSRGRQSIQHHIVRLTSCSSVTPPACTVCCSCQWPLVEPFCVWYDFELIIGFVLLYFPGICGMCSGRRSKGGLEAH